MREIRFSFPRVSPPALHRRPPPDTPPPARLLDLPTDLLERALSRSESPADIARVAAVSRLFHASLAEGIRVWVQERGFELPTQPEGEDCTVRWLCFAALLCESNPPARAAAGSTHSVFIDGEGRLSSCGTAAVDEEDEEDEDGEEEEEAQFPGLLGHGKGVLQLMTPTRLPSLLGGERAVGVAASGLFSLVLSADGAVWSWGCGWQGLLGHGDEEDQWQPKKVEAFAGRRVVAVSAGGMHSLALTSDGSVCSWGDGNDGRLGHGDREGQLLPKKIEALAGQRVVAVSAGAWHSLALTSDGAVWSWGDGDGGQLGHGDEQQQLLPKKVEGFAGEGAVSAGTYHSIAIADGAVFTWGGGDDGRLGHGEDLSNQLLPKKIEAWASRPPTPASSDGEDNSDGEDSLLDE